MRVRAAELLIEPGHTCGAGAGAGGGTTGGAGGAGGCAVWMAIAHTRGWSATVLKAITMLDALAATCARTADTLRLHAVVRIYNYDIELG